jgi:UDP-2-acetamido-2-deoxy-ribo-hexuluronate aminotransferase
MAMFQGPEKIKLYLHFNIADYLPSMPDVLKMIDLEKVHHPMLPELEAAIRQVIARSEFINGPAVRLFLEQLQEYTGAPYIIGCGNGTDALQLALMALELPAGAEVILPAFNYVSAAEVVALLGYKPVFADVSPDTFNLHPASLAQQVTANTAAVVPAHLFGQCADMPRIMALAREKGLAVIEDNAQSLGARCGGPGQDPALGGTIGQAGTTSFFPTKMLGGMGDGGAVFTGEEVLARRIAQLARHGQDQKYRFMRLGMNSRLDSMQAAVLAVKLRYLNDHIRARQQVAQSYEQVLQGIEGLQLPTTYPGHTHVYNQYTLRVELQQRDALQQYLTSRDIPTAVYYPAPLHLQPAFGYLGYQKGDFPVAEQLCDQVLSLPMHPAVTPQQIAFVGEAIHRFFRS